MREEVHALHEIHDQAGVYLQDTSEPVGPRLAAVLQAVRARTLQRIAELQLRLERIEKFEAARAAELAGRADFHTQDPRSRAQRARLSPRWETVASLQAGR